MADNTQGDDNVVAAISYIGVAGVVVYAIYKGKGRRETLFHATQSILLFASAFIVAVCCAITIVGIILLPFIWLTTVSAAVICGYKAYKGERLLLPVIGGIAEKHVK